MLHYYDVLIKENMSVIKKPINYLNNRDILKEIHLSKNSYCSFSDSNYHQYDYIVDIDDNSSLEKSLLHINGESVIELAKNARAIREKISVDSIKNTDLIFRVMTWDHIPLAPKPAKKQNKTKSAKEIFEFEDSVTFDDLEDPELAKEMGVQNLTHVRLNFPPFQHFKFDDHNNLYCVGKSHWIGDVNLGKFSKDHGQITNKLATMYLMLCEKYSNKWNWRGYTYRDEMQNSAVLQLTYVGLRFNEAKSLNPFAYYTSAISNSFKRVLNTEKRNQNLRDDILEMNNLNPSWSRQYSSDHGGSDD